MNIIYFYLISKILIANNKKKTTDFITFIEHIFVYICHQFKLFLHHWNLNSILN
jgi:hypothetical protein